MNAIEEMKVFSPFKMIEMSKDEIRLLGYKLGLPVNKFPSRPCLLTRFPYNTKINPKILDVINRAESYILRTGLKNFRIRIMDGEYKLHILDREREIFEKKTDNSNEVFESSQPKYNNRFYGKSIRFFLICKQKGGRLWPVKYFFWNLRTSYKAPYEKKIKKIN